MKRRPKSLQRFFTAIEWPREISAAAREYIGGEIAVGFLVAANFEYIRERRLGILKEERMTTFHGSDGISCFINAASHAILSTPPVDITFSLLSRL